MYICIYIYIYTYTYGGTDFFFLHLHCMEQLYCIARALGTTMCTVHCDASLEQVKNPETSPHRHMRLVFPAELLFKNFCV